MIWLNEDDRLIQAKIVSKNDEKLKEFIEANGAINCIDNYVFMEKEKTDKAGKSATSAFYHHGDWYYTYCADDEYNMFEYRYKIKTFTTLKIVKEALYNSCHWEFGVGNRVANIQLAGFFKDMDKEFDEITSIMENPYYVEFIHRMYADYAAFLDIFDYIDFEQEESNSLSNLHKIHELEELEGISYGSVTSQRISHEEEAKNNSKILNKTRKIVLSTKN